MAFVFNFLESCDEGYSCMTTGQMLYGTQKLGRLLPKTVLEEKHWQIGCLVNKTIAFNQVYVLLRVCCKISVFNLIYPFISYESTCSKKHKFGNVKLCCKYVFQICTARKQFLLTFAVIVVK